MNQTPNQVTPANGRSAPAAAAPPPPQSGDVVVEAVYQDGVFKPLAALDLPPGTTIQMRIASSRVGAQNDRALDAPPAPTRAATRDVDPAADFGPAAAGGGIKPASSRFPLPVIALGVALLLILAFVVFRSLSSSSSGETTTVAADGTEKKLSGPPLITPALAAGPQLPAPEVQLEIKLPALADGKPSEPRDVAVDSKNNIYVASNNDNLIRKFDQSGKLLTSWGNTPGRGGEPTFKELFGIVIDRDDTVYALDSEAGAVLRFDSNGAPKGEPVTGLGYFPRGISLSPSGEILVADTGGGRVVRINPAQGAIVGEYGAAPEGSDDASEPVDVAAKANGESFVCDARNDRIQRLGADGSVQSQWAINGKIAARDSGHVAIDRYDRLYFASPVGREITVFNGDGSILGAWPQPESEQPAGAYADSQGNLFVTFPAIGVVRKYRAPAAPAGAATAAATNTAAQPEPAAGKR